MTKRSRAERVKLDRSHSEDLRKDVERCKAAGQWEYALAYQEMMHNAIRMEDAVYQRALRDAEWEDEQEAERRAKAHERRLLAEMKRRRKEKAEADRAAERARKKAELPADWASVEDRVPVKPYKDRVTIRVDREVLRWFRRLGPGYQTRMNAVLRAYWEAKREGLV
jgi:uncharacterized protein (DUF4415 family)